VDEIRVLVVDDSAVIRRLLTDILTADPEIKLVGTAANGSIALAKVLELLPDVVTLDVEMPDVSGLEVLAQIRKVRPKLPVIMFSSLTQRAAITTLEALSLGASDYVTKPVGTSRESATEHVRAQLLPKIKALGRRRTSFVPIVPVAVAAPRATRVALPQRVDVVAIGASTGGPNALTALLKDYPADLGLPMIIVQHMPPMFTKLLAERLSATSRIKVHEAAAGDVLLANHAYIAPGDSHMTLRRDGNAVRVVLNQDAPENSCRPAVDVMLRSAATVYGAHSLTVILTGMGQDGMRGCEHLQRAGGQILIQDEASSVVWGMPGAVSRAGLADKTLPLDLLCGEIIRRSRSLSNTVSTTAASHVG
jgi:two-component system chemotaxis response regulator CheB